MSPRSQGRRNASYQTMSSTIFMALMCRDETHEGRGVVEVGLLQPQPLASASGIGSTTRPAIMLCETWSTLMKQVGDRSVH